VVCCDVMGASSIPLYLSFLVLVFQSRSLSNIFYALSFLLYFSSCILISLATSLE
ncbi:hypothetical protein F5148DRAFT_1210006, partial [Russula earlei]